MCVCSPFNVCVCVCEQDGANGWKSFIPARVGQAVVNRCADVAKSVSFVPVKG